MSLNYLFIITYTTRCIDIPLFPERLLENNPLNVMIHTVTAMPHEGRLYLNGKALLNMLGIPLHEVNLFDIPVEWALVVMYHSFEVPLIEHIHLTGVIKYVKSKSKRRWLYNNINIYEPGVIKMV